MSGSMVKDWNAAYEKGDMPWDKGEAAPPLRAFLKRAPIAGRVLVPGCGLGHDVRLLAKQGASTVGLEIAKNAVRRAQAIPANRAASFEVGDFLNLSDRYHGQFDFVVEHTCLCALDRELRGAYARSVGQALKPGGLYLAIFYRVVKGYSGDGPPHPITAEEIEALFGADFEMIEREVPRETYSSRPVGCEEVCLMRKR
ncbi:MAG: SAM-dependent methyltransferase [Lentimonas sp.]|jgi:SAM-dependent methyltransferase